MPMLVRCPNPACRASCSVAEPAGDRPVRCPKCGKPFVVKPTVDAQKGDTKKHQPSSNVNPFPVLPAEFGRYRVLRLLGRGGMGAVYLAQDSQLGRQVALKVPFFDASESPHRAERFVREARSAAVLQHPNICTVFDAGQIDGRPFITMAYIAGKPLEDEIDPDAPMPQVRAAEVVRKVALALEHAHRAGIVHRDLKPANVMLAAGGEPVVMDFGLAKRVADVDPNEAKLTRDGGLLGTVSYMAPEQVKGEVSAIGPATDVYALGVMLFEMLTGRTPFTGGMTVVIGQILTAPAPPVQEFRPDVHSRLDAICRKAMAKEPTDRFGSMAEFADALGKYLKAPTASPPPLPAHPVAAVVQAPLPVAGHSPFDDLDAASPPNAAAKTARRRQVVGDRARSTAAARLDSPYLRTATLLRKKWPIVAGVAAGLLVAGLAVLWAAGVFKVKTPDGILVVRVNEPNAEVFVDGDRMTVSWNDGGTKAEIHVKPGTRKVEVRKDGFSVDGKELTFKDGDREVFTARLLPEPRVANAEAPPPPNTKQPDAPPVAGDTNDEKGFEPLFDGKNLTDWFHEGDARQWTVEGDAIVGQSGDWKTETHLLSNKQYADFTLRLEFMVDPGSKGGIDLRAIFGEQIYPFTRAHPRFALSDPAKFPGDPSGTTHWVKDDQMTGCKPVEDLQLPAGSWHGLEITVRGDACTALLGGKKIVDIRLDPQSGEATVPALKRDKGRIGFQVNTGTVRFRHIEVKELSPADAAAPLAPAADGFVSLFNRKDLTGWSVAPIDNGNDKGWGVENGVLLAHGESWTTRNWLLSDREYSDFVLRLEFSCDKDHSSSGVGLRAIPGEKLPIGGNSILEHPTVKLSSKQPGAEETGTTSWVLEGFAMKPDRAADLQPPGSWERLEIEVKGRTIRTSVNGKLILDATLAPGTLLSGGGVPALGRPKGRIGLQKHTGTVRFRNIEIKELSPADAAAPLAPAADGFVSLFNGKDLTGWAGLDGFWSVKDGAISGHETKEGSKQTDLVLTAMRPADFELHYSYKFATPEGNSGVQVRSKVLDEKTYHVGGYQADCDAKGGYDGSIYDEANVAGGRGTMSNRGEKTIWDANNQRHDEKLPESGDELKKYIRAGDWNDCVVVAKGNHITYTVNGHLMTDLTDDSPNAVKEGVIALQLHAGFTMEVLFKDIKIKALTPPKSEDEGFTPLFNGKDLTGWKTHPSQPGNWRVENGVLTGSGAVSHLFTERGDFKDFDLRAEVRVNEDGNSGIYFRTPFGLQNADAYPGGYEVQILHRYDKPAFLTGSLVGFVKAPILALAADEWFNMEIIAIGNEYTIKVNNKTTAHYVDENKTAMQGHFALQVWKPATTVVQFRKIEIKELSPAKTALAPEPPVPAPSANPFQLKSVWVNDGQAMTLTVVERKGEMFRARFVIGNSLDREVTGTVKDGKVSWLAKDVRVIKGGAGLDNQATITSDKDGDLLDFTYGDKGRIVGAFVLRLKTGK